MVQHECNACGKMFDEADLYWGPDPFQSEINDDDTPMWLCDDCYQASADEI